jgi:phosphotriesterase-related protein
MMKAKVNTVLGSISSDELGITLMHEHITFSFAGWYADETIAPINRGAVVKTSLETLRELKTYGLKTFVDVTPNDSGRDAQLLKEVAEKSEMNIICATGLYNEAMGASGYFKFRSAMPFLDVVNEIQELFMREITHGIGSTEVKAGVIKVATGHSCISSYEEKVLKAAAKASKETGVSIITHTEGGTLGPEQADLLISEGADPKRILIGHVGGSGDLKYHTGILQRGVYIGFDRLGIELPPEMPDKINMDCIIALIKLGWAKRIMLSHDFVVAPLGRPLDQLLTQFPNFHPRHVFKNIIPALKDAGVTDQQVHMMMVENPRRLLGGVNN